MGLRLSRLRVSTDPLPSPPVPSCPDPSRPFRGLPPAPVLSRVPPHGAARTSRLPRRSSGITPCRDTGRTSTPRVAPKVPGRSQRRRGSRCHLRRGSPRAAGNPTQPWVGGDGEKLGSPGRENRRGATCSLVSRAPEAAGLCGGKLRGPPADATRHPSRLEGARGAEGCQLLPATAGSSGYASGAAAPVLPGGHRALSGLKSYRRGAAALGSASSVFFRARLVPASQGVR